MTQPTYQLSQGVLCFSPTSAVSTTILSQSLLKILFVAHRQCLPAGIVHRNNFNALCVQFIEKRVRYLGQTLRRYPNIGCAEGENLLRGAEHGHIEYSVRLPPHRNGAPLVRERVTGTSTHHQRAP